MLEPKSGQSKRRHLRFQFHKLKQERCRMGVESTEEERISLLGVPKIDISPLILNKGPEFNEKAQEVIQQIGDACKNWGFFYAVGHQISEELIERVKKEAANFIQKPQEFKELINRNKDNSCGYFALRTEYTKQKLDWKEGWDLEAFDGSLEKHGSYGVNQWPEEMPEFKATFQEYFHETGKLGLELMRGICASLNADMSYIEKQFGPHRSKFRLNFYPKCENPDSHFGVSHHTDSGAVTVLLQDDTVNSLQVMRNGTWYSVPPVPNSFVINIGDMVQVWSNGIYKAPLHRVLANKHADRYSFPLFFAPAQDTIVQPLEHCVTEKTPLRYKPIHWGKFRYERFAGNVADLGEEIQITHFEIKQ